MDMLENALKKAFINKTVPSSVLNPKFIINNPDEKSFLLTVLQSEFKQCQSFFLSVAFITQSGLNGIKSQLADLANSGISGKLLTSTYLAFNHPDIFDSLLTIPNLEVRISKRSGFHAKGYLFEMPNHQSFIIGSSNLTMSALKLNYEWNIKFTSYDNGEVMSTIKSHLNDEWNNAEILTKNWINQYRDSYNPDALAEQLTENVFLSAEKNEDYITPNRMQKLALDSLDKLRQNGEKSGLVISATGTGKTYLAAFDVLRFKPRRMLFIVHREQILRKALSSFEKIIGGNKEDYGILSGNIKELEAKYLFATIQTISKTNYQELLGKDAFDYILIDEVHKAGASTYINTIDYFEPDFLLGMTATPERTDGINIFELFDYNIAYEIRLQEALDENLLCPFYYFGVTDYEKDGNLIEETTDLKYLVEDERVDFLINKINYYGCCGNKPKGLVFCSRKEEAKYLAQLFNQRGIPSSYLSGDDKEDDREKEIEKLEDGIINYIFTVDIFNEGIDIPKVNQIIMLRNTKSSIIFIQQLGRGLRKDQSKKFVTVIDFIGNYKNNYMIPMALTGDHSMNKSNLRRDTIDATYITGLSAINFEQVAKERIFKAIDQAKLNSSKELKKSYFSLKKRLNRIPNLLDFEYFGSIDPLVIIGKEKTYYQFLKSIKEAKFSLSEMENLSLRFISVEFLSGLRPHELLILKYFIEEKVDELTKEDIEKVLQQENVSFLESDLESILNVLDLSFYDAAHQKRYNQAQLFTASGNGIKVTSRFKEYLKNPYYKKMVLDTVMTGIEKCGEYNPLKPLVINKKYRRKDALRLLNMEFKQNEQGIGGYTFSKNHFTIFVTLHKGIDFKASTVAYEDEFVDSSTFRWFTKSNRTINSKEVKILQDSEGWHIHLFIKREYNKKDNETDFYYLGEMMPDTSTIEQKKITKGDKLINIVEMNFKLTNPIDINMYEFLTKVVDS